MGEKPILTPEQATKLMRKAAREGRVEMAPAEAVENYQEVADQFMQRIFGLEPGDYMISDLSSLSDFCSFGSSPEERDEWMKPVSQTIREVYGITVTDRRTYLVDVFREIANRQSGQSLKCGDVV
jgi:acyl-CoA hydrolase